MTRPLVLAFVVALLGPPASSAEPEHWACTDMGFKKPEPTHWTIIEGRMFARNGKGNYTVVENTPTLTVAYMILSKPRKELTQAVYIIDKAGRSFVSYDDIVASAAVHFNDEVEPEIRKGPCVHE